MAFELAVYGGLTGLLYQLLPRRKRTIYIVLLISMVAGRIVWGLVQLILVGFTGEEFTWAIFIGAVVTKAIPGIILHIVLIPVIVMAMERADLSLNKQRQQ